MYLDMSNMQNLPGKCLLSGPLQLARDVCATNHHPEGWIRGTKRQRPCPLTGFQFLTARLKKPEASFQYVVRRGAARDFTAALAEVMNLAEIRNQGMRAWLGAQQGPGTGMAAKMGRTGARVRRSGAGASPAAALGDPSTARQFHARNRCISSQRCAAPLA